MFEGEGEEGQPGSWGDSAPGELLAGAVKSGGSALGGILDMVTSPRADAGFKVAYKAQHPQSTDQEADQAFAEQYAQTQGGRINKHLQDAAHWLRSGSEPHDFWEHVGAIGEQVLEYVGTEGLLKMAGNGARVAEAGSRGAQAAEQLKQAQQVAATLKANPKLAGLVSIGLKASKDAVLMGGQTYVHTEDPTQAAIAAGGGAVLSGTTGVAARYLRKIAPKNIGIAGEDMPALASQVNDSGLPTDVGAKGAPAVAQAQQQGAQNVIRNVAQDATTSALEQINRTRPVVTPVQDASRMLPAPEGAQPFSFSLEGPGTVSGTEGEMAQSAAKNPSRRAFEQPQFTTSSTATREPIRPGGPTAEEGQMGADIRTAGAPEAASDVASGGGSLQTTDPREAEGWLRQLEDLQGTPEFSRLPEAQQSLVRERAQALDEQLALYHASPYGQRFAPIDTGAAAGQVRTFGDAAAQIEAAARPVYATLDRVSGGEFNKYKEAAKQASRIMRSATSVEAFDSAAERFREANGKIDDIINSHRSQVSNQDYITARNAWRNASRLNELHAVFEGMMNGVTMEQSDQGMTRVMTGGAKRLEAYLAKGTNREQLEQLIGKEGLNNLTQITLLLKGANTARATHSVAGNVAVELGKHLGPHVEGGGMLAMGGALAGGGLAHMLGIPTYYGAIGGALGTRAVLRIAATSPAVGKMVDYAVRNGISPQVYAPLIARTIAEPFQSQKEAEPQEPAADGQQ